MSDQKGNFGKLAVEAGFITKEQLKEAIAAQNKSFQNTGEKLNLGIILVDLGYLKKEQIKEILSKQAQGVSIPGFDILSKLGAGNMGAVYKAVHLSSQKEVALKIISDKHLEERFIKRFAIEFDVLKKLAHPNIVEAVAIDINADPPYYAMEFMDGPTIRNILKTQGKMPIRLAVNIIQTVASALKYAQSHNILHRDIKPDNLLANNVNYETCKFDNLKIIDFGLAKDQEEDSGLTMEGTGMGTPLYMAPEQVKDAKNVDFRADIYSLGATLFKLISSYNAAHGKSSMEIVANVVKGDVKRLEEFEENLHENVYYVVNKMMALDPNDRYKTYEALIKDLEKLKKTLAKVEAQEKAMANPEATETPALLTATGTQSQEIAWDQSVPEFKTMFGSTINKFVTKEFWLTLEPVFYIFFVISCFLYMVFF